MGRSELFINFLSVVQKKKKNNNNTFLILTSLYFQVDSKHLQMVYLITFFS